MTRQKQLNTLIGYVDKSWADYSFNTGARIYAQSSLALYAIYVNGLQRESGYENFYDFCFDTFDLCEYDADEMIRFARDCEVHNSYYKEITGRG